MLHGAMRNPTAHLPTVLDSETLAGVQRLTLSLTFKQELLSNGPRPGFGHRHRPSDVCGPYDRQRRKWCSTPGRRPRSSPSGSSRAACNRSRVGRVPGLRSVKMRYLDDPAFGAILGGVGAKTRSRPRRRPASPRKQSQFRNDHFVRPASRSVQAARGHGWRLQNQPARNAGAPSDTAKSRGLRAQRGPTRGTSGPMNASVSGRWSPTCSSHAGLVGRRSHRAGRAGGQVIPLVEDSQNNNSAADVFLWVDAAATRRSGTAWQAPAVPAPAIQPNQWFRLAISVNHYGARVEPDLRERARSSAQASPTGSTRPARVPTRVGATSRRPTSAARRSPVQHGTVRAVSSPGPSRRMRRTPTASTFDVRRHHRRGPERVRRAERHVHRRSDERQRSRPGGPSARGSCTCAEPVLCAAEFDGVAGVSVADLFGFLDAWFAVRRRSGNAQPISTTTSTSTSPTSSRTSMPGSPSSGPAQNQHPATGWAPASLRLSGGRGD